MVHKRENGGGKNHRFSGFLDTPVPLYHGGGGWFEIEWYLIILFTENLVLKPYDLAYRMTKPYPLGTPVTLLHA